MVLLVGVLLVLVVVLCLFQYWLPRAAAFRDSRNRVRIWFGQGEIVLWNPGQTFAFLRNKHFVGVGDVNGGMKSLYAFRNEEAIGPISLQIALFNWEDTNVLTRDGQPIKINIGVWWKVADVEKYVFHIYSEQTASVSAGQAYVAKGYAQTPVQVNKAQPMAGSTRFDPSGLHVIADRWLRVLVEGTIRNRINKLAVADVVSAQAMAFLQVDPAHPHIDDSNTLFEASVNSALSEVQAKALEFGLDVERMEVQHVYLPQKIQDAINEARIAFLAPIKGEREAEAQRIQLEKLVSVLGKENVALNQIMSNLKNANFVSSMPVLQTVADRLNASTKQITAEPVAELATGKPNA